MMDHVNDNRVASTRGRGRGRRGNAMILVAGILVLLVIIATAYITRTQGGRVTAAAVQQTATRVTSDRVLADALAGEIAGALFPRPVNHMEPRALQLNSNTPRLSSSWNPQRYGIDRDILYNDATRGVTPDLDGDGVPDGDGVADFPFNFAPYQVAPITNWPDGVTYLVNEGNPPGEPGFGDTRWLRDTEPVRWDGGGLPGAPDSFRYWRHLTNIARPNNAFRICADISNVERNLVTDLGAPVEQWQLALRPADGFFSVNTGNAIYDNFFVQRWDNWFDRNALAQSDVTGSSIPPNLYELKDLDGGVDLDGDGDLMDRGERPQDQFVGPSSDWPSGTPRWNVGRVLADADGDGFTDSFWYLVPGSAERGVRQIAAVSIVDNSGLFNANVATNFWPGDTFYSENDGDVLLFERDGVAGETPADLAASGAQVVWDGTSTPPPPNWNVGFFDTFHNWEGAFDYTPSPHYNSGPFALYDANVANQIQVAWEPGTLESPKRWNDYVSGLGLFADREGVFRSFSEAPEGFFKSAIDRRRYWRNVASRPLDPLWSLTPFGLSDEVELRMYHGQNHPWIMSRFERSVNTIETTDAFLRSGDVYEETTPYSDQLHNSELLHDNRRKITLYSGARNETMPPWLWWRYGELPDDMPEFVRDDINRDPGNQNLIIDRWVNQSRLKLDLREPTVCTIYNDPQLGQGFLHERLPWTILHALSDGDHLGGDLYIDPIDGGDFRFEDLRRLAASFTANILAYRDVDDEAPLYDDVDPLNRDDSLLQGDGQVGAMPLPTSVEMGVSSEDLRYLGMERQPFIAEVYIAHVYKSAGRVPETVDEPHYWREGWDFVVDDPADPNDSTTIVVVQLMSPFEGELDLDGFRLEVAGQSISLDGFVLPPATELEPASAICYSIASSFGGQSDFRQKWFDFLDIEATDLAPGTIYIDADAGQQSFGWSKRRAAYDGLNVGDPAVRLIRVDRNGDLVVIDRTSLPTERGPGDPEALWALVRKLPTPPPPYSVRPDHNGIRLESPNDHWVTWARFVRPYGNDFDFDPTNQSTWGIQPWERAPRFVFAKEIGGSSELNNGYTHWSNEEGDDDQRAETRFDNTSTRDDLFRGGDVFAYTASADDPWFRHKHEMDAENPWAKLFGLVITDPNDRLRRKPTFFNMNVQYDGGRTDRYPTYASSRSNFYILPLPTDDPFEPRLPVPAKGYPESFFSHSLQMLQKNSDFQQIGELLNVWLYTHEIRFNGGRYEKTMETFSEAMARELSDEDDRFVNRLRPGESLGVRASVVGIPHYDPVRSSVPVLPAGYRLLDAFVCDGRGQLFDFDGNGLIDIRDLNVVEADPALFAAWEQRRFSNAQGFGGTLTPGLINLNTAPVEVLRTLPHWYRLVHGLAASYDDANLPREWFPRTAVADSAVAYRELSALGPGPNYAERRRSSGDPQLRDERGFASIGELQMLLKENTPFQSLGEDIELDAWRIDFAGSGELAEIPPFARTIGGPKAARISTDVVGRADVGENYVVNSPFTNGDGVSADSEKANLLFAGVSNLVTTRSDVFTVYFRVRSFRQNPTTRVWDATNPEYIVDDSRYVMLVDRSEVNRPSDRPKVLYLEKVPN